MLDFQSSNFPNKSGLVRGKWAPILIRPIINSPEQLVVGIVAVNDAGFFLQRANGFDKLWCLFGDEAKMVALAANAAMDALEEAISTKGQAAVFQYEPILSSVAIGNVHEGEGASLEQIAVTWMQSVSSLYVAEDTSLPALMRNTELVPFTVQEYATPRQTDRLPELVLDYVQSNRPGLVSYFRSDIRAAKRKRRKNVHEVFVDFAGSKLVCNFGTLAISGHSSSVDRIKRRMWDLKLDRDSEKGSALDRKHEMIVQRPAENDPQFSEKQLARIGEALAGLEKQADTEEIRFRHMTTVDEIGKHLVGQEAA